jgi:hypothetical protein
MRFEVDHEFTAARASVAIVLCDPAFHAQLDLPDMSRPEIVESTADGSTHLLRLRYEYIGQLDPIARRVVGGRKLTWIQELRFDTSTYAGTLSFEAEADARRLNGSAEITVAEFDDGTRCTRRIAGDFHVRVPLIGGQAERSIVPGLVRRLDVEAAAVSEKLAEPS